MVYIDGFNLYYGAVKNTEYRWLDISKLCNHLFPGRNIVGYKYFTAMVSRRPDDPQKPLRQQVYIRALKTIPNFEVFLGHFLTNEVWMRLAHPPLNGPRFAKVLRTEEKGSDVNLATHLLHDAFRDIYDVAIIVSNDSDLLMPIRVVMSEFRKRVDLINPQRSRSSKVLHSQVSFIRPIRKGVLASSQFPDVLSDSRGPIYRPEQW